MPCPFPEVQTLLPHRPPMLLVEQVLSVEEKTGRARAVVGKNHLFLRADGTLAPEVCCELLAQGFGACEACRRLEKGLSLNGGGYLASMREVEVLQPVSAGDELTICSEKTDECFNTYIVRGEICRGQTVVAKATVYIFMFEGKEPPQV